MGRPSRLKPRFPRIKPSDYLDHPDCPNQYAMMTLCLVTFGGTIVDKGGLFANDLNFSHNDFNEDYIREFPLAQQAEYEDLGGMDLSMERWDHPTPTYNAQLTRNSHRRFYQLPVSPIRRLSLSKKVYFKFITLEHEQRESQRAALWVSLYLDLRI